MLNAWGKIPETVKCHCLHTWAGIPSRAESTHASASSSQKKEFSKSRWGFWGQSNPIFCSGHQEYIRRHIGTLPHVPFGTRNKSTSSGMCSVSLTLSGSSAPVALKQPHGIFHLESMPALSPSHPGLLPKMPASHHCLSPRSFIPCASFTPIAAQYSNPPTSSLFLILSSKDHNILNLFTGHSLLYHALTEAWLVHKSAAAASSSTPQRPDVVTPWTFFSVALLNTNSYHFCS